MVVDRPLSTNRGSANSEYLVAKLPNPPPVAQLRRIPAKWKVLPAGTELSRIYFANSEHPTIWNGFRYFGPTKSRFDHHLLDTHGQPHTQTRGIMYLATGSQAAYTCLAEVFQDKRTIDRNAGLPTYAGFLLEKEIHLLDLTAHFATQIGASTAIHSGPRPSARRWAQALYEAYLTCDGILYCSSMFGNEPAIALFERAQSALPSRPLFHRELRDSAMTAVVMAAAAAINYAVA